jgi:hypothetical protein
MGLRRSEVSSRFKSPREAECPVVRRFRLKERGLAWLIAGAAGMALIAPAVMADSFGPVHYDAAGNQLIVTMVYEGTRLHHHFSVHWGRCRSLNHPGAPPNQINVQILDDQGDDAAKRKYTRTLRISLASPVQRDALRHSYAEYLTCAAGRAHCL